MPRNDEELRAKRKPADRRIREPVSHVGVATASWRPLSRDRPMRTSAGLPSFLREFPAALLVRYRNDDSVSIQIRRRLKDVVPWEWPKLGNQVSLLNANLAQSDAPNIESFEPLSSTLS